MDSKKLVVVLIIEAVFLLAISLLVYVLTYREIGVINARYLYSKLIFVSTFFLLFRYIIFTKHSLFVFSKWVKRIVFAFNFLLFFMIYRGFRAMILEFDSIDLLDYTSEFSSDLSPNSRVALANDFRKSWIFFGVGSLLLIGAFQVRLVFFRWKKWMIT